MLKLTTFLRLRLSFAVTKLIVFLVLTTLSLNSYSDNTKKDYFKSEKEAVSELNAISEGLQDLKSSVIRLNSNLRVMEEKLLFPSNTRYTVFVSISSGRFFNLESVKLKLDGELVASHIYTDGQRNALRRGGIQKLYVTNLNAGSHNATAFFTGTGPNGRPYKIAETLDFDKSSNGEYLELAIGDDGNSQEPVVRMKQW